MNIKNEIDSSTIDVEKFAIWGHLFETLIKALREDNLAEKYQDLVDHLGGRSLEAAKYFFEFIKANSKELVERVRLEVVTEYVNKSTLNPDIWVDGEDLPVKLRKPLLKIAKHFVKGLDEPEFKVLDITLTGSNAAYNWEKSSDMDIHILTTIPDESKKFYLTYSRSYNKDSNLKYKTYPIELYIQDNSEEHAATGVYSILKGKWLLKPEYKPVNIPDEEIVTKAAMFERAIDKLATLEEIKKLKDVLKKFRAKGLAQGGEYSIENLVFKHLRNNGYLAKIKEKTTQILNKTTEV
jgi:hypothetical protein